MPLAEPAVLRGRDRYERTMEGWVDNTHAGAFTHTVRLAEPERAVELALVAQPSPAYEILEARCRVLEGDVAADVVAGVPSLVGARMVGGFTRRVAEVTGSGAGAALVVDAAIEAARLARQVTQVPPERAARAAGGDPWECWQIDTTAWAEFPDSCFTYSPAGRALFGTRTVTTPMRPDLYSPAPGQTRVFVRRKTARVERAGDRLRLVHSMHDDVHGFDLTCEVDLAAGTVVRAESVTSRLPYQGICTEPQGKIRTLVGEPVDAGLRKRLSGLVGGSAGCAQLYDVTADLFRLLQA
jgi:hypothetical protein